jgi:hypothetical protein
VIAITTTGASSHPHNHVAFASITTTRWMGFNGRQWTMQQLVSRRS